MNCQRSLYQLGLVISLIFSASVHAALTKYTDEATYLAALAAYDSVHESFETGTWTSARYFNSLATVANNGIDWEEIIASYPADSSTYLWKVPFILSDECKIRITAIDQPGITILGKTNPQQLRSGDPLALPPFT